MGESKRRKQQLGDEEYLKGQKEYAYPFLPITKRQSEAILKWTTKGAWVGIGSLVVFWVVLRFIGPSLGWWQLLD
ncbi:MAG: DUF2839 domain-containing protein [Synechococcales cyanobacterium RU_4_20]|nr:DUF2839 domain-containing protein [Synechococcales cyanobacterium RU_4_20]NJR70792.1 DUF2839 domain-containing protein [Synechococcales cyanobacterium CRU_2_2]